MISKLFLESPWLLLVLLVAMQFAVIAIWSRNRNRAWARVVWTGFALVVALPAFSLLVVTPRERVIGLCRELAVMVDAGDVEGIAHHLSDEFAAGGLDRVAFLDRVEERLSHYHVDYPTLRHFETAFPTSDEAVVVFDAACSVRSVDAFVDRLRSRWRLRLRKYGQQWRVTEIEALPTPLSPIRNMRDWLP